MNKRFWAFFLSSLLLFVICGQWITAKAQLPSDIQGRCSALLEPVAIALPANSELDAETYRPRGRQQSYRPCEDTQAIIGSDEHLPVLSRLFPWLAIGRLEWVLADGTPVPWCTGTLIGKDLLLTNAHCLERPFVDSETGRLRVDSQTNRFVTEFTDLATYQSISDRLVFKPNLVNGRSQSLLSPPIQDRAVIDSFEYGTETPLEDSINDWALLKLNQPLGETYGYLGWRVQDFSNEQIHAAFGSQIILPGYSGDYPTEGLQESLGESMNTAAVHVGCSVLGLRTDGTFVHECDTIGGASGSPFLALFDDGNYYIVGLHAGNFRWGGQVQLNDGVTTTVLNYGVPVSRWAVQAAAMRDEG